MMYFYSLTAGVFNELAGECREDAQRRHQAYINTWGHIKQCIDVREFLKDHKYTSLYLAEITAGTV